MPRYKRSAAEASLDVPTEPAIAPEHAETLRKLRNMWEFASLMQYIFLFGTVVKIDEDFDIEDLEHECLQPHPSERLASIGLALLKYVSSHRGLTPELFDEYTRRQYLAKAPSRNPFGDDETPTKFNDLDVYTRVQVLQQLSTWTLGNAERIRNLMSPDEDHLSWRIEPVGWDKDDRAYFVLDDNRLYRRTDEPARPLTPPPKPKPKPKSKSKKATKPKTRGTRSSKRRKVESEPEEEDEDEEMADAGAGAADETLMTNGDEASQDDEPSYGFTNKTWECIAITLEEYQEFLSTIFRSRDLNEKQLRKRIEEDVIPVIEKRAEAIKQKQLKKLRELENMEKMATAKRSSRLAGKAEKEQQERTEREAEEKKRAELRMAHEEQDRQKRIEEGHESRRLTREQRVKEREVKRILHEEELARLEADAERAESQDPNGESAEGKRLSERQLKTQKEQLRKQLDDIAEQEKDWVFDCSVCGMHGENFDDGTHSIACERCSVWQHSKCHGFTPKQSEREDFHFVCATCKRKEEDANKPKIPTLKLGKSRASGSPEVQKAAPRPPTSGGPKDSGLPAHVQRQLDGVHIPPPQQATYPAPYANGHQVMGQPQQYAQQPGQTRPPSAGFYQPPSASMQQRPPQQVWQGSPLPPPGRPSSSGYAGSPPVGNGYPSSGQNHQNQHQYAHHNAIHASGGHPGYQPQAQAQSYSNPPRMGYPMSSPPALYPQAQGQAPMHHTRPPQQQPYRQPAQPPHRPESAHLMNGFQSPTKRVTPSSPALPPSQPTPQPRQSPIIPSPHTSFPPPSNGYDHAGHSPTKSSPPAAARMPQPISSQPFAQPNLQATPSTGNGHHYSAPPHHLQTPTNSTALPPAPASATANGIAADGMSGPWPEQSKVIPQKHDQSPAPLPLPTATPSSSAAAQHQPMLAPSPVQNADLGKGSVPVKRDIEGLPGSEG